MTADLPSGTPAPARLGSRFLARVIDTVVLVAIDWLLAAALAGPTSPDDFSYADQVLLSALVFVLYFAYEGAMTSARGQTLGKMVLGIRVVLLDGGAVPAGRPAWTRAAVYALPGVLLVVLIGPLYWLLDSLWCAWDRPNRQCLHDKAAGTVVVAAG
ncbi:RDD family protein [Actinacidiphila sp. ITFR-21]|uniref:RDD family protein n=1 Tax=Actinacidiphila sp. ITFR-21 TaxID=3075199 RepID=UPI00288A1584|nr:RDD family protein [Streptomyces sp. ITFR-21]WNI15705.1 RDD family protein [Streptomyces sp. ITFR-21]